MSQLNCISAKAFDHVTIICRDLEATRRFYVDFLGLKEVPRPEFAFPGRWFQLGEVQIHATQESKEAGEAGWASRGSSIVARGHHFAFAVNDMSEAVQRAEQYGVRVASPLQQRPDGFKQLYLYDPDGHVVELVCE
jgi:catechol 2,3-dioxygenase-like lactoylglutathione lyase family enzyme